MSSTTGTPGGLSAMRQLTRVSEPGWRERLNRHPMAPYYMILGASMLLLVVGLVIWAVRAKMEKRTPSD